MPKLKTEKLVKESLAGHRKTGLISSPVFSGTPGRVWVERSRTVNLGDFNSLKITVGVDLPIEPDEETLKKVNETVTIGDELVENRIVDILERVVPDERVKDYSK